ncbi:MAG TPA: MBL fold metallo-hydrolase [Steroidobacteraceae bacterium]
MSASVVAAAAPDPSPTPQAVGHGVWLLSGGIPPDREPDGNTVVFAVPDGLVVMDTGRHPWHRQAILDLAGQQHRKIVAIVNSHWHLDHVSGNPALRAAFPKLRVYASDAIDTALTGFLANSARQNPQYAADPSLPASLREDIRADTETIRNGNALKPDESITASRSLRLGGHRFDVHLARHAATDGDVWLFDSKSGVAATGDLVTLPAPFLDTACPAGWKAALAEVAAVPFKLAVPGHGPSLTQAQFDLYRQAFERFIACADSSLEKGACGSQWADDVKPLLAPDGHEAARATSMATYYVEMLRANGGKSKYCTQ